MQLNLQPDEAAILRDVLNRYLGDLRMEIGKTEAYDARQELHQRETVLYRIVAQLGQAGTPA